MTKHLATTTTLTLLVLVLSAAPPATAAPGSLLSGYGGPGQGSQAILGTALLNGPSSGSPGAGAATATTSSSRGSAGAGPSASGVSHPGASRSRSRTSTNLSGGKSSNAGAGAYPASDEATPSRARAADSSTLGLSGADLLYLLLALGALALTAMLTRGFARDRRGGNAHG